MLSDAAQLLDAAMRRTKGTVAPLAQRRSEEERAMAQLPVDRDVTVGTCDVVGDSVLITPSRRRADLVLLYLHGGAYVTGSARGRVAIGARLARETGAAVLSLDYRLAPEHPYPAALTDTLRGLELCGELAGRDRTVLVGDSAGGGLAVAAMLRARDLGLALPLGAVLFSPWADLTLRSLSVSVNVDADAMLTFSLLMQSARSYAKDVALDEPWVSPAFADLTGLPPLEIFVSNVELLLDDSLRLAEIAARDGVLVDLHVRPEIFHAWPVAAAAIPEAEAALESAARFIEELAAPAPARHC